MTPKDTYNLDLKYITITFASLHDKEEEVVNAALAYFNDKGFDTTEISNLNNFNTKKLNDKFWLIDLSPSDEEDFKNSEAFYKIARSRNSAIKIVSDDFSLARGSKLFKSLRELETVLRRSILTHIPEPSASSFPFATILSKEEHHLVSAVMRGVLRH